MHIYIYTYAKGKHTCGCACEEIDGKPLKAPTGLSENKDREREGERYEDPQMKLLISFKLEKREEMLGRRLESSFHGKGFSKWLL